MLPQPPSRPAAATATDAAATEHAAAAATESAVTEGKAADPEAVAVRADADPEAAAAPSDADAAAAVAEPEPEVEDTYEPQTGPLPEDKLPRAKAVSKVPRKTRTGGSYSKRPIVRNVKKADDGKKKVELTMDDLSPIQRYVLGTVATLAGIPEQVVVSSVATDANLKHIEMILPADTATKVLLFATSPGVGEGAAPIVRLATDSGARLSGDCVFCVRTTKRQITVSNIAAELNFALLPIEDTPSGLLKGLHRLMDRTLMPMVQANSKWGKMKAGDASKENFFRSMNNLVGSLSSASASVDSMVRLKATEEQEAVLATLGSPKAQAVAATKSEVIDQLQPMVDNWCAQVSKVILTNEQIRSEADNVGPKAELEHWKHRTAAFNGLLDQMKQTRCVAATNVLQISKSKVMDKWRKLDVRITEEANEAKDNVKFLQTIDELCEPLYQTDLAKMEASLPELMNAVAMIYSVSQFYNTPEHMSALFVKITNQMITSSREYVCRDEPRIWEQDPADLSAALHKVQRLHAAYQRCFESERDRLAKDPTGPQFDFSVMSIFGKSILFITRTKVIERMLGVTVAWSKLVNCKIDGIEPFNAAFRTQFKTAKSKSYDPLDIRVSQYVEDCRNFEEGMGDSRGKLQEFCNGFFNQTLQSRSTLHILARFEPLRFLGIELGNHYASVLKAFARELEEARKMYQTERHEPIIPRNVPPMAGRIMWARQLFARIQCTMSALQDMCPDLLRAPEAKKIIRNYNKLGRVLMDYEMVYYDAWSKGLAGAESMLQASLLVLRKDERLAINWDPATNQLLDETKFMRKLNLDIPEIADNLLKMESQIKSHRHLLERVCEQYAELLDTIPEVLLAPLEPILQGLRDSIRPGLESLNWKSVSIDGYITAIQGSMSAFEADLAILLDVLHVRIDAGLMIIRDTQVCAMPDDESWSLTEFEANNSTRFANVAISLESQSLKVEMAVVDLANAIKAKVSAATASSEQFVESIEGLHAMFAKDVENAVVTSAKQSLDALKRGLSTRQKAFFGQSGSDEDAAPVPVLITEILLKEEVTGDPDSKEGTTTAYTVSITPTLEEMQQVVASVAEGVINTAKAVKLWGTRRGAGETQYTEVARNKDVLRLNDSISTVINQTKGVVTAELDKFNIYEALWKEDRGGAMATFLGDNPDLGSFEMEVAKYDGLEQEVTNLAEEVTSGPLALGCGTIKKKLVAETTAWKSALGESLNAKSAKDMAEVFAFTDDLMKRLGREITDLEDVRLAMNSLKDLRENEIKFDTMMAPIEQGYQMLQKNNVTISKEEQEQLDSMRFQWDKLTKFSIEKGANLIVIQPKFKTKLIDSVTQFQKDQTVFMSDYNIKGPMVSGIAPREASDRMAVYQTRFDEIYKRYVTYSGGEELFGLAQTEYPDLARVKKELGLLNKLYSLYNDVVKGVNGYYDIKWVDVDVEAINNQLLEFGNRCRKLPKALKEWDAYIELQKVVDDFMEVLPLLEQMANPAMMKRHWKRIEDACKCTFDVFNEAFELRGIMEAPILENKEDLEDICIAAVKELDIDGKLKEVNKGWSNQMITFAQFKTRGEFLVQAGAINEFVTDMEDALMILGSLMSNRYNAPFKADIQKWVRNLSDTSEILERWLIVQNLWVYLEAVFVGGDIAKQLPKEAKRFANIDKSWVKVMTRAHENPNLIQCCVGDDTMKNVLPHLLEQLEVCQKSLTGYLEKKRLVFPRFFFVSDPVLLEILGQASDSHTIQDHLLSLFDNVKSVSFHEKNYDDITEYHSKEGETVQMPKVVKAQGNVEVWLGTLLGAQQLALGEVIADAAIGVQAEELELIEFMNSYPSQVGILGIQVLWTLESEQALEDCRFDKKAMQVADDHFLDLLTQLIDQTLCELTKLERRKFETLVTLHVHQRDIFHDDIVVKKVKTVSDFEWSKQARFYFNEETRKLTIDITDWTSKYCLEFIGCVERLCVTPLTDRCYITLAQALLMSMGGAPAGPAGTGKTETTKDMGRALGKYVVVFNCSDQMDFRGLGRIYKGLAQSGSWGCFDEFNRIELPVLSVAAQQIKIVLDAKLARARRFIFMDGDDVSLDPEFGLFLTMNPGYAGRQELPENLKIQFRTVAMMVPDRQIIIRVKLAACGFQNNVVLARKFFTLYKLCEEQLTKQVHYDFGLRNILSVVRTLGAAKRLNPEDSEMKVVMRVLRDMNLSKMVDQDEPLFLSLINDLFPGIELDSAGYPELEAAIDVEVQKAGLVNHAPWTLKLIQLFETQRVRHGYMVLGPSGAGKTESINCLTRAMTATGVPHREMRMNPKAITAPQMFGRLDVATNDWTDGIFSTLWRRSLKGKKGEKIWIVLDGPVDAVWIENLNSVLDDNKLLTLANGDRIPMSPDAKLVFEPHNVDNASPATVSRNGMVFMSSSALDWEPILDGWLKTRPPSETEPLRSRFQASYQDIQTYARFSLRPKMVLLECNYIRQCCDLLDGIIPKQDDGSLSADVLGKLYTFVLMWSVGSCLELDDRQRLQEFIMAHPNKVDVPKLKPGDSMFDYTVDLETGQWVHWQTLVEVYDYPTEGPVPNYNEILVPNVDNVRTSFLVDTIAKGGKPVLLLGEAGTAKTVILKNYCLRYDPENHMFKILNFSSTTTPNGFQRTIESYVDKRMGSTYGPPAGRKMTVFIDDINMPLINEWKDQIANEIVRQTMSINGFYSLDKPGDFTTLADMQWVAAMPHPGGGRNDIPERLKRQFNVFNCTLPSNSSIETIFQTLSAGYFHADRGFSADIAELTPKLVAVTRRLWQDVKVKMLPTPAKFHYVFNLRDISRIFQGMLNIQPSECPDTHMLMSLWRHECTRVIADRFTNLKDVAWFTSRITTNCSEDLGEDVAALMDAEPYFVDFLRDAPEPTGEEDEDADLDAPKVYEIVSGMDRLETKLFEYMELYNETVRGTKMDLVFFKDCMVHIVRVSRIIRTDGGSALLVGVGGSGKQSVTRLASAVARYSVFQITLTRTYNATDLLTDIKQLYRIAGSKGQGVTFILTDNEIKSESFLEFINNMLATGEIGGLFARDEIDEITSELINVMKAQYPKRIPTNDALYGFFIERVRANLHTCLCFSPVSEKFRQRALKFPAVFSGCTMDWFMAWPKDALVGVADHILGSFEIACSPDVKQAVVTTMGIVQDGVGNACEDYFGQYRRRTYVTPASYLSFLNSYRTLYRAKKDAIDVLANQMTTGLTKLIEAGSSVATLSKELAIKEVDLAVANKETAAVLVTVTASAAAAEIIKAEVQVVKDRAQGIVDAIDKDKIVAEGKLAAAVPALKAAEAALATILPAHIATVKKLGKPPHLIKRIMDVVLILFARPLDQVRMDDDEKLCPNPTWIGALKMMNGPLLSDLMSFNKDTINEEMVEFCAVYVDMEDYTFAAAKKACGDVAGLTSWTEAMCTFFWSKRLGMPRNAAKTTSPSSNLLAPHWYLEQHT